MDDTTPPVTKIYLTVLAVVEPVVEDSEETAVAETDEADSDVEVISRFPEGAGICGGVGRTAQRGVYQRVEEGANVVFGSQ
jgi:hypothetical protein